MGRPHILADGEPPKVITLVKCLIGVPACRLAEDRCKAAFYKITNIKAIMINCAVAGGIEPPSALRKHKNIMRDSHPRALLKARFNKQTMITRWRPCSLPPADPVRGVTPCRSGGVILILFPLSQISQNSSYPIIVYYSLPALHQRNRLEGHAGIIYCCARRIFVYRTNARIPIAGGGRPVSLPCHPSIGSRRLRYLSLDG